MIDRFSIGRGRGGLRLSRPVRWYVILFQKKGKPTGFFALSSVSWCVTLSQKKGKQTGSVTFVVRAALSQMIIERCDDCESELSNRGVHPPAIPYGLAHDLPQAAVISCSLQQPPSTLYCLCSHKPRPAKSRRYPVLLDLATIFISDEYAWHVTREGKFKMLPMLDHHPKI